MDYWQMLSMMFYKPDYVLFKIGPNEYELCPLLRVYHY